MLRWAIRFLSSLHRGCQKAFCVIVFSHRALSLTSALSNVFVYHESNDIIVCSAHRMIFLG